MREIGILLLIVSIVLFVSAMVLLGANVSEMRRDYARVQHSNEELRLLALTTNDILRVEMIVRGYALSEDPIYLTWHKATADGLHARMTVLDKVFTSDLKQKDHVRKLKALLVDHCTTFDRLMLMVPADKPAVTREIVAYGKQEKRRPLENLLVYMRNEVTDTLEQQQRDAEERVISAYHSAIAISALALVFGALGFALVIHDRRAGRRRDT